MPRSLSDETQGPVTLTTAFVDRPSVNESGEPQLTWTVLVGPDVAGGSFSSVQLIDPSRDWTVIKY